MNRIFTTLRRLLAGFGGPAAADPLSGLSLREFADLPAYHPKAER